MVGEGEGESQAPHFGAGPRLPHLRPQRRAGGSSRTASSPGQSGSPGRPRPPATPRPAGTAEKRRWGRHGSGSLVACGRGGGSVGQRRPPAHGARRAALPRALCSSMGHLGVALSGAWGRQTAARICHRPPPPPPNHLSGRPDDLTSIRSSTELYNFTARLILAAMAATSGGEVSCEACKDKRGQAGGGGNCKW